MNNDDLNKDLEEEMGSDDIQISTDNDADDVAEDQDMETSNPVDVVKKLKDKLKTALDEKQKYLDNWQRDKAEFINSRKRDSEDKKQYLQFAEENLILELLTVLDSFDMAMGNKEAWEKADKNWRTGVEYIRSQLVNVLEGHGLKKIDPLGKPFDPKEHHSVGIIETKNKEDDHKVMEVVSSGYSLNGKVIKAPNVKVGEFK